MQIAVVPSSSMDARRVLKEGDRLYTWTGEGARSLYGEKVIRRDDVFFREWIPWRSKLSALLKKQPDLKIPDGDILYLGAAQGTTVSHLSDITSGVIYAVEFSGVAFRKLSTVSKKRSNIVPILEDAFHPERYASLVPQVDLLYQDVSQKDQTGMCLLNARRYLKTGGTCFLMLKARSVDVTADPEKVYRNAVEELGNGGFEVELVEDLGPFQKDHAAIVSSFHPEDRN